MPRSPNLLEYPLDWVFSAPSHIAVLRALRDSREGMSGRAVARLAGVNHQACAVALKKLEGFGLVKRRGSGKTQLVSLNFRHFLIQEILLPALRKERELMAQIRREITSKLGKRVVSAALFGSVARGEARPGSDVDLLLLVPASASKDAVADEAQDFSSDFTQRYGVRLSPIVLTSYEAKKRIRKSDPLLEAILKEGIDLGPKPIREVLS